MRPSTVSGLLVPVVWVLVDSFVLLADRPGVGPGAVLFGLGVVAPVALLTGALVRLMAHGWRRGSWAADGALGLGQRLGAWWGGAPERVVAALTTGVALLGALLASSLAVGSRIVASVRTPAWAVAALMLLGLGLGVGAVALAPALYDAVRRAVARVSRLHPWLGRALRPVPFVVVLCFGATLVGGWCGWRARLVLELLPWRRAAGPALGLGLALLTGRWANRSARVERALSWLGRGLLLVLVALGLLAAMLPRSLGSWRATLGTEPSLARSTLGLLTVALDFDGDGAIGNYGGEDCAPWDSTRGPYQTEIPNDGIDQDCSGSDLVLDERAVRRGSTSHGHPSGLRPQPNLVLITTDALTFDHTGLGGYGRDVTPALDAWASHATVFENAFATTSATSGALPALFTGVYALETLGLVAPRTHGPNSGRILDTLAQVLHAAGYATHAIVGTEVLFPDTWPALLAGFDQVDTAALTHARTTRREPKIHAGAELTAHAIELLERHQGSPLFLWVHYYDHHPPHALPNGEEPFGAGRNELDRYDTELRYADRHWGQLLDAIGRRFAPAEVVVIFTADHGEAFDDNHPAGRHDESLRTAEIHVPFVIQGPAQRGARRAGLVSHLDLVPTVLDLAGVEPQHRLRGESLVPALFAAAEPDKTLLFAMLESPDAGLLGRARLRAIALVTPEWLYLDDREHQNRALYDWHADPLQRRDLGRGQPLFSELARYLVARELESVASAGGPAGITKEKP